MRGFSHMPSCQPARLRSLSHLPTSTCYPARSLSRHAGAFPEPHAGGFPEPHAGMPAGAFPEPHHFMSGPQENLLVRTVRAPCECKYKTRVRTRSYTVSERAAVAT